MAADQTNIEQLVLDTLFERRLKRQSCFFGNEAGEELIASPPAALPVIESVVRDTIEPAISGAAPGAKVFGGLDYVLGAYLVISAQSDPERAVRFLSGQSEALRIAAMLALITFFRRMSDGYNCGVAPPRQFRTFAKQLAASDSESLRSAAELTLKHVTWPL